MRKSSIDICQEEENLIERTLPVRRGKVIDYLDTYFTQSLQIICMTPLNSLHLAIKRTQKWNSSPSNSLLVDCSESMHWELGIMLPTHIDQNLSYQRSTLAKEMFNRYPCVSDVSRNSLRLLVDLCNQVLHWVYLWLFSKQSIDIRQADPFIICQGI